MPTEGGDPFLSGVWYLPPGHSRELSFFARRGYALIVEIVIEFVVLRKFLLDSWLADCGKASKHGRTCGNLRTTSWR